jgi:hypothetical protein
MRGLARLAGALSLVAGLVHGGLGPEHFREWWGYGVFFAAASVAQVLLGLALLLDAFEAPRPLYVAGIVGNALLLGMYVVSRTWGIPFFGPAAGGIEEIDALGLATQAVEIAIVALLATLLRRPGARPVSPA